MGKNEKEIHRHLRQALRDLTPDEAEKLWNTTIEKASGQEWYLDGTGRRRKKTAAIVKTFAALAACLVLCFSFATWRTMQIYSTVYLDVNPSITLEINRKDRVVKSNALNEDGEKVLDRMNLKNTDIDVAVNAILGSMMKLGYLGEEANVILLSVESKNEEKATDLSERLSDHVELCLSEMLGENSVYYQAFERDDEISELEQEYGISAGKAAVLLKIAEKYPNLVLHELTDLTMNELNRLLNDQQMEVPETVGYKSNKSAETLRSTGTSSRITVIAKPRQEEEDDEEDEDDSGFNSRKTPVAGVSRDADEDDEEDEDDSSINSRKTPAAGDSRDAEDDEEDEDDSSINSRKTPVAGVSRDAEDDDLDEEENKDPVSGSSFSAAAGDKRNTNASVIADQESTGGDGKQAVSSIEYAAAKEEDDIEDAGSGNKDWDDDDDDNGSSSGGSSSVGSGNSGGGSSSAGSGNSGGGDHGGNEDSDDDDDAEEEDD